MKAIIIYQGKYGATKQYALWLGHELGLPVRHATIINREQLEPYDTLIIGSSVYIGKLQIRNWLKYNLDYIRHKKIVFYQVAGTPASEIATRQQYNMAGIPEAIFNHCSFYYLPGSLKRNQLSWKDRLLLKMGAWLTKDPRDKAIMLIDYDNVKKEHLAGMIKDMALQDQAIQLNEIAGH